VIFHTVVTIIAKFFGLKVGPLTRDLVASKQLLHRSAASQTPELKSKADAQKQMP
jgi:hypothetical protein